MISKNSFLVFIFFLLIATELFAQPGSVPSAICKSILEEKEPSAFLFHKGQLWNEKEPINLGELETGPNGTGISSQDESYLILIPAKYKVSASADNALAIKVTEVPASCPKTRQYKIKWSVYPANLGPGRFKEDFGLYFDGPSVRGYSPSVRTMFSTSVIGFIHGPGTRIEINKAEAKQFFLGLKSSLSFLLKNTGDRDLQIIDLKSDLPENSKEIRVRSTDCLKKVVEPTSSCVVDLERNTPSPKSSAISVSYALALASNEVGAERTMIYLEYDEKLGVRAFIKRWE